MRITMLLCRRGACPRATLAVAYVSADARHATEVVSKAMTFIEDNVEGRVLETFVEIL